jgi:hypothetical protein
VSKLRNLGGDKEDLEVDDWYPQIFISATPTPAILELLLLGFVVGSVNENAITLHSCSEPELNVCI